MMAWVGCVNDVMGIEKVRVATTPSSCELCIARRYVVLVANNDVQISCLLVLRQGDVSFITSSRPIRRHPNVASSFDGAHGWCLFARQGDGGMAWHMCRSTRSSWSLTARRTSKDTYSSVVICRRRRCTYGVRRMSALAPKGGSTGLTLPAPDETAMTARRRSVPRRYERCTLDQAHGFLRAESIPLAELIPDS